MICRFEERRGARGNAKSYLSGVESQHFWYMLIIYPDRVLYTQRLMLISTWATNVSQQLSNISSSSKRRDRERFCFTTSWNDYWLRYTSRSTGSTIEGGPACCCSSVMSKMISLIPIPEKICVIIDRNAGLRIAGVEGYISTSQPSPAGSSTPERNKPGSGYISWPWLLSNRSVLKLTRTRLLVKWLIAVPLWFLFEYVYGFFGKIFWRSVSFNLEVLRWAGWQSDLMSIAIVSGINTRTY